METVQKTLQAATSWPPPSAVPPARARRCCPRRLGFGLRFGDCLEPRYLSKVYVPGFRIISLFKGTLVTVSRGGGLWSQIPEVENLFGGFWGGKVWGLGFCKVSA